MGTILNDIYVSRTDANNNIVTQLLVPITYGPKDKVLARVTEDPILDRPYASILPYISYEMKDIRYDRDRHLNTTGREIALNVNKDLATSMYNPVAFDFDFEVNIIVKNLEDGTKIIEQILPFFTPDWTTSIKLIDNPLIVKDIPIIFNEHNSTDTWQGNFEKRRQLVHTLKFTLKGYLFGPITKSKIIKIVKTNLGTTINDVNNIDATIKVTPGLTSAGFPTSNAAATIPYSDIDWTDDYGFVVERDIE
jgi:T4-like virus Myoviridae tail sheath stabiliser